MDCILYPQLKSHHSLTWSYTNCQKSESPPGVTGIGDLKEFLTQYFSYKDGNFGLFSL